MLLLWLVLLSASLLAACGEKEEPDPAGVKEPLAISYSRGGGIAGVQQRVEITAEDEVLVSLDGEQLHGAGVDAALATEARRAVESLRFGALQVTPKQPAPDEFTISIAYGNERISGPESRLLALGPLRPALDAFDAILGEASATKQPGGGSSSQG